MKPRWMEEISPEYCASIVKRMTALMLSRITAGFSPAWFVIFGCVRTSCGLHNILLPRSPYLLTF